MLQRHRQHVILVSMTTNRRDLLRFAAAAGLSRIAPDAFGAAASTLIRRTIPVSGELLPAVGIGTWRTFDVGASAADRAPLRNVLSRLIELGGGMVDSSPMYGEAERVVGDLAAALGKRADMFLATKVWTRGRAAGIAQMEQSFRLLRTPRIDLMQVHNLLDTQTHFGTLREWKDAGRIRYLGITHYQASAFPQLEQLIRSHRFDFVQFNFSMAEREAEARLLPLCAEHGTAVIVNRPFAHANLFGKVKGKPVPAWAAEFDCTSWAQFFLKWILGHPAVTCVIPGTARVDHLEDNIRAGTGRLPDTRTRGKMLEHLDSL